MTRALWILIQKQSCSSCVIFIGSTFSRRCIRDLGYSMYKYINKHLKNCVIFKGKFHWFSCFLWLPDSLKHFWGIIKLVSINAYPRDDNQAYVLFITLFLKSTRAWAIKVVPRAPTIISAPRRKSTWRWNRRTWWSHAFCALRFRAWKFAVDSSNAA
jgi:hypothetical protein